MRRGGGGKGGEAAVPSSGGARETGDPDPERLVVAVKRY